MALSPQLLQFKSSGVYRLEFDKSQTVNIPAETIRLVVGRSKKGPYNTPVLVEDVEQFKQVFGGVDKSLEKKGMYFHRSAIEALSRGPILALNLTAADAADRVSIFSPATNSSQEGLSANSLQASNAASKQFNAVFDTDKFWNPNDEKLLAAAAEDTNHAISFVNIKQDPITVIIRQAGDVRGFELTAREWYGESNIPEGIDADEYVSDYLVDVFVFKGKFDAAELNNDPNYGNYFTQDGLLKSEFAKFAGLREVTLLAQYSGVSLIPEFIDAEGNQMYIETLINMEARRTGLFCAVQEDALPQIDLVGNNFDIYQDYEILSHKVKQVAAESIVDLTAQAGIVSVAGSTLTIQGNDPALSAANLSSLHGITDSKYLEAYVGGEYVKIESITNTGSGANGEGQVTIVASGAISKSYEKYNPGTPAPWASNANFIINEDGNIVVDATPTSYESIVVGNFLESVNAGEYVAISNVSVEDGELTISCAGGLSFSTQYGGVGNSLTAFAPAINTSFDVWTLTPNARAEMFPTLSEGWTFTDNGAGIFTLSGSNDATWNSDIKVGMYVPGDGGKLSRIKKIVKTVVNGTTY